MRPGYTGDHRHPADLMFPHASARCSRRPLFMISCALQAFWMFLLAGLGSKPYKTTTESNAVVAAFMLYSVCYSVSGYAATVTLSSCIICVLFAPLHLTPPHQDTLRVLVQ